jgi:hypothetical protein
MAHGFFPAVVTYDLMCIVCVVLGEIKALTTKMFFFTKLKKNTKTRLFLQ